MAKYFEKISDLFGSWYDGLSDRERRLVTIFSTSLAVLFVILIIYIAFSKINTKQTLLQRNREQLTQIKDLEGEYSRAKEKHAREMERIRRNDTSLFTYIQSITSRLGLSVPGMTEQKKPLGKTNVVEVSVKVNLTKLSLDKLTRLLELIESPENGGQVKVTRLKINKRHDEPDLLDLQMTVSTWKST
jgi:type II secretory pathway component PulM